ncbi:MAG: ABC transporter permease [Bacillota bacterium]
MKTNFKENFKKNWYKFYQNKTSVLGLIIVIVIILMAIFAPYVTPYPQQAGVFTDFNNTFNSPQLRNIFGTDEVGRDVFTRVIFGFRFSLILAATVLLIGVPLGTILGITAGYFGGWVEIVIMRFTDMMLSIPPLVMALSISAVLSPNLRNMMIALAAIWWTWYTRLVRSIVVSLRNENFIKALKIMGIGHLHIMFVEILPNCISQILVKMTLDIAFIIQLGAGLSFLGLGAQPPTPALGTMISYGTTHLPTYWWLTVFPALGILFLIFGFNWLADGLKDVLDVEL